MEETKPLSPMPTPSAPQVGTAPLPPLKPSKLEEFWDLLHTPWAIAAIVIVSIIFLIGIRQAMQKPQVVVVPTSAPTASPTPTPIRQLSAIATTSAFLNLDTAVSSLSTSVKSYNTNDPSLSPPVIDLPLGF